ncbi:MAG: hypothetical protein FWD57_12915, partial [Polyangiaceae bacterium]|nr:hypothetical protein [Polyangiaceae bacterium]
RKAGSMDGHVPCGARVVAVMMYRRFGLGSVEVAWFGWSGLIGLVWLFWWASVGLVRWLSWCGRFAVRCAAVL